MIAGRERSGSVTDRRDGPTRPLLSVREAATLLGMDPSTLYRAINRAEVPFPVIQLGGRLRIPRAAIDRLINGEESDRKPAEPAGGHGLYCSSCKEALKRPPMCSAARRSSSGTASV